jgi:hypothetical protein
LRQFPKINTIIIEYCFHAIKIEKLSKASPAAQAGQHHKVKLFNKIIKLKQKCQYLGAAANLSLPSLKHRSQETLSLDVSWD